ncbi:MAG: hypothetical protein FJ128_02180 [Deltaproteobacteria bacterium]|nr:hypothetical protein [Deltaproteobacteria bacterium]
MHQSFVICLRHDDYPASLGRRKIYVRLHDPEAEQHHYVRVIDESGDDYLYPDAYFMAITLSEELQRAVIDAAYNDARARD